MKRKIRNAMRRNDFMPLTRGTKEIGTMVKSNQEKQKAFSKSASTSDNLFCQERKKPTKPVSCFEC